ncbi:MAG: hypothetical protein QW292_09805 [Candidatus Parvarchaeota archaeon]
MNINEQKEKFRTSLYLDNETLSVLEDLRYLTSLDGRNMRAIPDFTDVVDGMVYFFYYMLCFGAEDTKVKMLRNLNEGSKIKIFEDRNSEIITNISGSYSYPQILDYESKVILLKESQKKVIDKIAEIAREEIELPETFDYSEIIKKIILVIIGEKQLLLKFFDFLYIGNLYGLLPVTIIKLYSTESKRLISFEDSELKRIKFIRSDGPIISELHKIQEKMIKVPIKKQPIKLENELFSARNRLSSMVSDFNYVDAFYGYILSLFYLVNGYKSLTSLITDIDVGNILFNTFSKPVSGKETSLYLHYFAIFKYLLASLNLGAITYFINENHEIDNAVRMALISGMFNPYDIP